MHKVRKSSLLDVGTQFKFIRVTFTSNGKLTRRMIAQKVV